MVVLATPIKSIPKYKLVLRRIVLMAMCEAAVLVSTKTASIAEEFLHENLVKIESFITAKRYRDLEPVSLYYITIAKLDRVDVIVPNHQKVVIFTDVL